MRIIPSIMARKQSEFNFLIVKLGDVAPVLHLDVVDGKFARNHSLDFDLKIMNTKRGYHYQMHLMVQHPERWVKRYWGVVDLFIPQIEALKHKARYIHDMKKKGRKIAFALLPGTKISDLVAYVKKADYVLVLTVEPGFYGGKFLSRQLKKIRQIKRINPQVKVMVDGGMNPDTIQLASKAGADFFVSGHFVSQAKDPKKALKELEKAWSKLF